MKAREPSSRQDAVHRGSEVRRHGGDHVHARRDGPREHRRVSRCVAAERRARGHEVPAPAALGRVAVAGRARAQQPLDLAAVGRPLGHAPAPRARTRAPARREAAARAARPPAPAAPGARVARPGREPALRGRVAGRAARWLPHAHAPAPHAARHPALAAPAPRARDGPRPARGGYAHQRRPRGVRETVQTATYQTRLYAGRRRPRARHPLRERVLADDHM